MNARMLHWRPNGLRVADTMTVLVMACALALPALLWNLQDALGAALARQSAGAVVLFLRDGPADGSPSLSDALDQAEEIERWEHLSAGESRAAFMAYLGLDAGSAHLESVAVPATTTVHLRPGADNKAVQRLLRGLANQQVVADIWWDQASRERDLLAYRLLRRIGYALAFVLIGSGLAIIGGSIAGRMARERPAITVMTLLGATDAFIVRPHLLRIAALSTGAALLALLLLQVATAAARSALVPLESLWGVPLNLAAPGANTAVGLLICAIGLGTTTAFLVVRQHLRDIRHSPYGH